MARRAQRSKLKLRRLKGGGNRQRKRSTKREVGCHGKIRYRDAIEANAAKHRIVDFSGRRDLPVRVYACPRCNGFHLTSRDQ